MLSHYYRALASIGGLILATSACSSDSSRSNDESSGTTTAEPSESASPAGPTPTTNVDPTGATSTPNGQMTSAMPSGASTEPAPSTPGSDSAGTGLTGDSTVTYGTLTEDADVTPPVAELPSSADAGTSNQEGHSTDTSSSEQDSTQTSPEQEPARSVGCGMPFAPEDVELEESFRGPTRQTLRRTVEVASVTREYLVTLPVDYDAQQPYALIFAFHGLGGDREQLRSYMNMERPADAEAIVIYPAGLETERGTGWDLDGGSDDLAFVDALLEHYTQELCIDETRIYAMGHSYGGCMSNSVGCFRGDIFRAIAPVAGCGPFGRNVTCSGQVAALVVHSPFDTVEEYSSAVQGCTRWLRANSCEESPECGCHWEDPPESADQCTQTAQQSYTPGASIEVTERDERDPVFRQYTGCDEQYPVITADYWRRERQTEGDPEERWHNPPPWAPDLIWEFFSNLPPVQ